MTMLTPLNLAVAPTLGGILQESFGWQYVFSSLALYATFIIILTFFKKRNSA